MVTLGLGQRINLSALTAVLLFFSPVGSGDTSTQVSVQANQPWTDTGIDLALGSNVTITASGIIRIAGSDPGKTPAGVPECAASSDFVAPGLPCWSLIGRVGSDTPFYVGTAKDFSVTTAERLFLGVNDNFFGDNTDSWAATVTVTTLGSIGPDANGDGVWDYIESHIDQTYPDSTTRAALRAIAVAMQSAMLVANDPAASANAATALQRAIECLYFVRPDDARAVKNDVKAVLLNTLERSKAYLRFSDQLGGQIFPTTPLSELQSACNF